MSDKPVPRPVRRLVLALGCVAALLPAAVAPPLARSSTLSADKLQAAAKKYFPTEEATTPARRLFRLTRDQLDATVQSLLPKHFATSIKIVMPRDPLQTNYEFAELIGFNAANHAQLTKWIGDIAARVRKSPAGVVDCPRGKADPGCLGDAARRFAVRAFRGDLGGEEDHKRIDAIVAFYLKSVEASGFEQGTADLVEVVLNSPRFLFRAELDTDRRGRLSPAQRLQAITYMLADAPPERLGLDAADALRHVQAPGDTRATLEGIGKSTEARAKLMRFFKAWLEIREPGEFLLSSVAFKDFNDQYAARIIAETDQFLATALAKPGARLADLVQTVDVARGTQRFGILSHPSVIASHSGPDTTRPIKRGIFWVRKVMCMQMQDPPKEIHLADYKQVGNTERERIESVTKGPACLGCHQVIDPFAFFLESYDALGRWRTTDNGSPVNAAIRIDFLDEAVVETKGPADALRVLTGSAMFKQCFVRQLFRFYMGREEEPGDDPLLKQLFLQLAGNDDQDISGLIQALALSDRSGRRG